jgi:hypothetical protein
MDTMQLDFFTPAAPQQMRARITENNELVLQAPSIQPRGAEAEERRAARLREIEDRKRQTGRLVMA